MEEVKELLNKALNLLDLKEESIKNSEGFVDIKKLKVGMKLRSYYVSEYDGNKKCSKFWAPTLGVYTVEKIDGNLVFVTPYDNTNVLVWKREEFSNYKEE